MDAGLVMDRIARLRGERTVVLIGIGGRGAVGKTTLARQIDGAQLVSTDEFWDGEGFDLSRLHMQVVQPLMHGEAGRYHAYAWPDQRLESDQRLVRPEGVSRDRRRLRSPPHVPGLLRPAGVDRGSAQGSACPRIRP